jgi:hypothetical protein
MNAMSKECNILMELFLTLAVSLQALYRLRSLALLYAYTYGRLQKYSNECNVQGMQYYYGIVAKVSSVFTGSLQTPFSCIAERIQYNLATLKIIYFWVIAFNVSEG